MNQCTKSRMATCVGLRRHLYLLGTMEDVHSKTDLGRHVGEWKPSSKVLSPPCRMLGQNKQPKNQEGFKKLHSI